MAPHSKEEVLITIKSILVSTQEPLNFGHLERDFTEWMGHSIPFADFGYGTLEQFLRAHPQHANVYFARGSVYVQAPRTEDTQHITKLVQGQKRSKTTSFFAKNGPAPRKPRSSNWIPPLVRPQKRNNSYYDRRGPAAHFNQPPTVRPQRPTYAGYYPRPTPNLRPAFQQPRPPSRPLNMHRGFQNRVLLPNPPSQHPYPHTQQPKPANHNPIPPSQNSTPPTPYPNQPIQRLNPSPEQKYTAVSSGAKLKTQPVSGQTAAVKSKSYLQQLEEKLGHKVDHSVISAGKSKTYYLASLHVDGQMNLHSSYPHQAETQSEAIEIAAKVAFESLIKSEGEKKNASSQLREASHFDLTYSRVKLMLENNKTGLWWEALVKEYNSKYKEALYDTWLSEAQSSNKDEISFEKIDNKRIILRPKANAPEIPLALLNIKNKREPPPLKLSPEGDFWYVSITYIKNCANICFNLIGEEYNEKLDTLRTEMDLYYMDKENCKSPNSLKVGQYYVCYYDRDYLRGKIVSLNENTVTVDFIDYGDQETLPSSDIYFIEDKFLDLPAQGIAASLRGLEGYMYDEKVQSGLSEMILNKGLIAEVFEKQEKFVSVVLYDTSSSQDININEELLKLAFLEFEEPELPSKDGICEAYVINISELGVISVVIETKTYKLLKDMLLKVKDPLTGLCDVPQFHSLYLAKFSDENWHRSMPKSDRSVLNPATKISCHLAKVPPLPPLGNLAWTDEAIKKLQDVLPHDEPVMLSVVEEGNAYQLPVVELFKTFKDAEGLLSINDYLIIHKSLFRRENNILQPWQSKLKEKTNHSIPLHPSDLSLRELALSELYSCPEPDVNEFFDVHVTFAASPSNFAVQAFQESSKMQIVQAELNDFYKSPANLQLIDTVYLNGYYAHLHSDNEWYRVRIDHVDSLFISGSFVDYGDSFFISIEDISKIQPLWQNFRNFPMQSFKAKLSGVSPTNADWSPEDNILFNKLVSYKNFVSNVVAIEPADSSRRSVILELQLIDTSDESVDVYIDQVLIKKGIAVKNR